MNKLTKTQRGFAIYKFKDRVKRLCTLQKSSLATQDCIWLGLNEPEIKEFYPSPRDTDESWFDCDLDKLKHRAQNEIYAFSRMELTRKQVEKLIPYLQKFVDTGELI